MTMSNYTPRTCGVLTGEQCDLSGVPNDHEQSGSLLVGRGTRFSERRVIFGSAGLVVPGYVDDGPRYPDHLDHAQTPILPCFSAFSTMPSMRVRAAWPSGWIRNVTRCDGGWRLVAEMDRPGGTFLAGSMNLVVILRDGGRVDGRESDEQITAQAMAVCKLAMEATQGILSEEEAVSLIRAPGFSLSQGAAISLADHVHRVMARDYPRLGLTSIIQGSAEPGY